MKNELLTLETAEVDPAFLKVKDLIALEAPNEKPIPKEERNVRALVDLAYELLDEDEKKRRRLAGYRITTEAKSGEEIPSREAPYKRGSVAGPVQYKDISAKPKETLDARKNVAKGYLGLEFNALNEVKHEHHVEKKKDESKEHYAAGINHKHEAGGYSKALEKHSESAHFHSDGSYHAVGHKHNHNHSESNGNNHNCSNGCGNSYVGKTPSQSIFRARA